MTAQMKTVARRGNAFIFIKGENEELKPSGKFLSFLHVSIKPKQKLEENKMSDKQEQFQMPAHGTFCWMELNSTNIEACKSFYSDLFGWKLNTSNAMGIEYTEIGVEDKCSIGGMFQMPKEFGDAPSHWMAYIAVDDVDAAATRVFDLGGKICVPPTDIPNVGRFCVINDPSGATFSVITLKHPGETQ